VHGLLFGCGKEASLHWRSPRRHQQAAGKAPRVRTHLLRRSWREGSKVRNETVGNISHLPAEVVELVRAALKGERFVTFDERFAIERS